MYLKLILIVFTVLATAQAGVVTLDDSNFTSYLQANSHVFVAFYAPWCDHCQSMAPQFEKLGDIAEGKAYHVAKVDATKAQKVDRQQKILGFPTLRLYVNQYPIPYDGERTVDEMQKWVDSYFSSKINTLSESELNQKIGKENFLLIQGAAPQDLKILQVAKFMDERINYFLLEGTEATLKITLYLENSKTFQYSSKLRVQSLIKWTFNNFLPPLIPLHTEEEVKLAFHNKNKLPVFLLGQNTDFTPQAFKTLENICEESKERFICCYASRGIGFFPNVVQYLKMENENVSVLAYISYGVEQGWAYPEPNSISKQGVEQFLTNVADGNIPTLIGQQPQKSQNSREINFNAVLQLTGDTFKETIQQNEYVFVKFYSPTCGHCIKFAPEYQSLAKKMKKDKSSYLIAAVDMNEHSQTVGSLVDIQSFPTLYLYVRGQKVEYSGDRKANQIYKFIRDAATAQITRISSLDEILEPSVVLYNIKEGSNLNLLSVQFNFPIYSIQDNSETFKAEFHNNKVSHFEGSEKYDAVATWIQEATQPTVVNAISNPPSKKLNRAIISRKDVLVLTRKDQAGVAALKIMEDFCAGKSDFICAYADKTDEGYDSFLEWLGDEDTENSRIVLIDGDDISKTFYQDNVAGIDSQKLEKFVSGEKNKSDSRSEEEEEVSESAPEESTGEL